MALRLDESFNGFPSEPEDGVHSIVLEFFAVSHEMATFYFVP